MTAKLVSAQPVDRPDVQSEAAVHSDIKPIVLVGLMGVGKTSVGRRLAANMGRRFLDADTEIEKAAGRSVAEIFADFGEASFRDGERKVISRILSGRPDIVLATGGGAFVDEAVRTAILERAISIWLDAETDILVERTSRRNTRPLLKSGDPAEILAGLAKKRRPFYAQANIRIESGRGPASQVVAAVERALAQHGAGV